MADAQFGRQCAESKLVKLWELRRTSAIRALEFSEGPRLIGVTVRADTEAEAREFARRESPNELSYIWIDDNLTVCVEVDPLTEGNAGVVLAQWIGSSLDASDGRG